MRRPVRAAAAILAATALGVTTPVAAHAEPPPTLRLLEPTGPHAVSTDSLHLRDESRPDPWVPGQPRELMLTMWYPADREAGRPARYVSPAESRLFVELQEEASGNPVDFPKDVLSTVGTSARSDAPVQDTPGGFPLVLLSPGWSFPRATMTGMAEDLASHGYAVAAIGHNHESAGTEFPDGRVTECPPCWDLDPQKVISGRAKDVSFVLDELATHPEHGPRVDGRSVAMVGHSIGGASSTQSALADPRIDAAVNLDGTFFVLPEEPIDTPVLMLGQPAHAPGGRDDSWDRAWERLHGWKRWITMDGTGHSSATDVTMLFEQLGIRQPGETTSGARAARIADDYVRAFLDLHLRGTEQPLLDGPVPQYPEVRFWHRS